MKWWRKIAQAFAGARPRASTQVSEAVNGIDKITQKQRRPFAPSSATFRRGAQDPVGRSPAGGPPGCWVLVERTAQVATGEPPQMIESAAPPPGAGRREKASQLCSGGNGLPATNWRRPRIQPGPAPGGGRAQLSSGDPGGIRRPATALAGTGLTDSFKARLEKSPGPDYPRVVGCQIRSCGRASAGNHDRTFLFPNS